VVTLQQARAEELGVKLVWQPADEMPTLLFDPEAIHGAMLNVVSNAIDACEDVDQGKVSVRAEFSAEEKIARLIVEDNGPGIEPDDLDAIFNVFVSRKGGRGTGLGLPVSRKVFEEHGGQILVESQLGQGSRFTLELPSGQAPIKRNPAPNSAPTVEQTLSDSSSNTLSDSSVR